MFIKTKRLLLRPAWPEDARALAHAINDWDVVKNLATVPYPYRPADAEYFIERCLAHAVPQPSFLIIAVHDVDQPLVGGIGFGQDRGGVLLDNPELGYWIAQSHWGRGYATEAANAVLELAFLGYGHAQLEASYMIDNDVSAHILERKLGFVAYGLDEIWCEARQESVAVRKLLLRRAAWQARWANMQSADQLAA